MLKKSVFLLSLVMVALLMGCATNKGVEPVKTEMMPETKEEVIVDKTGTLDAPSWALSDPSNDEYRYAYGVSDYSDPIIALEDADLNARRLLASEIASTISGAADSVAKALGNGQNDQSYREFVNKISASIDVTLVGCKRTQTYFAKDGKTWVQVGIPVKNITDMMNATIDNILNANPEEAPNEMDLSTFKKKLDSMISIK